jgi:hypothetical protein
MCAGKRCRGILTRHLYIFLRYYYFIGGNYLSEYIITQEQLQFLDDVNYSDVGIEVLYDKDGTPLIHLYGDTTMLDKTCIKLKKVDT